MKTHIVRQNELQELANSSIYLEASNCISYLSMSMYSATLKHPQGTFENPKPSLDYLLMLLCKYESYMFISKVDTRLQSLPCQQK